MKAESIIELKYSNTNTYLIRGINCNVLWDTGWAGTFNAFCSMLGEKNLKLQDIDYLFISHFHPDHMGIAGDIAKSGVNIVVCEPQIEFLHKSDIIFEKENNKSYTPIDDQKVKMISISESRAFLEKLGISGEVIYTPGHSDDSISMWLNKERALLVGDLNPLYELEMHKNTQIEKSWNDLLKLHPKTIYYGHAKTCNYSETYMKHKTDDKTDTYKLVKRIVDLIDRGYTIYDIHDKTSADLNFIEDVNRMYLTHQNISVQGILDRIEIKGK